jgi:drug/metabolite transporter (DMT)-like permease
MSVLLGVASSLGAALCWTATAALLKIGSSKYQPITANAFRVAAGAVGSILLLLFAGEVNVFLNPDWRAFTLAFSAGLLGIVVGDTLYIYALKSVGVARAMPVANTYPLFSTVGAFLLLGEAITPQVIAGALLIILGLWLISPKGERNRGFTAKSFFLTLSCAPIWGAGILLLSYALNYYSVLALNAVRLPFIAAVLIGFALSRGYNPIKLDRRSILVLSLAGVLGLSIGSALFLVGIESIGVARAVPLSSTSPIFSTIVGSVFLRERVTLKVYLSALLVVLGIIQITLG